MISPFPNIYSLLFPPLCKMYEIFIEHLVILGFKYSFEAFSFHEGTIPDPFPEEFAHIKSRLTFDRHPLSQNPFSGFQEGIVFEKEKHKWHTNFKDSIVNFGKEFVAYF